MGFIKVQILKRINYGETWPLEHCTVAGKVSGFIGGMTGDFKTDDRGIAEITWGNNNDIDCLFIKGNRYEGPFESGRSYTIVVS